MKGLILKDFYSLRQQGKIYFLLLAFYIFYSSVTRNISMMSGMVALICALTPITTIAYDENCKWDRYALSMPISRKTIVLSKYVFGILLELGSMVIVALLSAGIVTYTKEMDIKDALNVMLVVNGIGVLFLSVILPLLLKFGVQKARLIMFILIVIPTVIAYFYEKLNFSVPSPETLKILAYLSPVFLLIIVLLSIVISIRIYEKKEF